MLLMLCFDHVLLAARLSLFNFDVGNVEVTRRVHVVGAVLMSQGPYAFRTRSQR